MSGSEATRRERLDRAVRLKKSRELGEAMQLLEGLVAEDGEDGYALGHLAHALLLRGRAREAAELAGTVLAKEPGNAFVHYVRGDACMRLKRWQDAAADLEAALAGGFRSGYIYSRLAEARARLDDADGSRRALEKGLAAFPGDAKLLLALGRLERRSGDAEVGRRHIEEAAGKLPDDPYAYKELLAARASAPGKDPVAELRRLLKVPSQATNPHLHDELARRLSEQGDAEGAAAAARRAHELAPDNRLFRQRLSFALARARRDAEAAAELEACLDLDPEDPALNRSYVACRRRLGQLDQAHAFYTQLLRRHPECKKVFGHLRRVARAASE